MQESHLNIVLYVQFSNPPAVPLFHALLLVLCRLWRKDLPCKRRGHIPLRVYCDNNVNTLDINRLGGVYTHLFKKHKHLIRGLAKYDDGACGDSVSTVLSAFVFV